MKLKLKLYEIVLLIIVIVIIGLVIHSMLNVYEESQPQSPKGYHDLSCKTFWVGYTCVDNQSIDTKGSHDYSNAGSESIDTNSNASAAYIGER